METLTNTACCRQYNRQNTQYNRQKFYPPENRNPRKSYKSQGTEFFTDQGSNEVNVKRVGSHNLAL